MGIIFTSLRTLRSWRLKYRLLTAKGAKTAKVRFVVNNELHKKNPTVSDIQNFELTKEQADEFKKFDSDSFEQNIMFIHSKFYFPSYLKQEEERILQVFFQTFFRLIYL